MFWSVPSIVMFLNPVILDNLIVSCLQGSVLQSHWSRFSNKEAAQGTQSPQIGTFLAFRWIIMASYKLLLYHKEPANGKKGPYYRALVAWAAGVAISRIKPQHWVEKTDPGRALGGPWRSRLWVSQEGGGGAGALTSPLLRRSGLELVLVIVISSISDSQSPLHFGWPPLMSVLGFETVQSRRLGKYK